MAPGLLLQLLNSTPSSVTRLVLQPTCPTAPEAARRTQLHELNIAVAIGASQNGERRNHPTFVIFSRETGGFGASNSFRQTAWATHLENEFKKVGLLWYSCVLEEDGMRIVRKMQQEAIAFIFPYESDHSSDQKL